MNLSLKDISNSKVEKLSTSNKATTLNPNAAEYIPATRRSTSRNSCSIESTGLNFPQAFATQKLNCSESSASCNSDDEAHQYWCRQLPDDITLDFNVVGENELHLSQCRSLADLSLSDSIKSSQFDGSVSNEVLHKQQNVSSHANPRLGEKMGVLPSSYAENQTDAFPDLASNSRRQQLMKGGTNFPVRRDANHYYDNHGYASQNDLETQAILNDASISQLDFLASQFPGLSREKIAEVFSASGCNLDLTIEHLTELQLIKGGLLHKLKSKASAASSFDALDFPASRDQNVLSRYDGNEFQHSHSTYKTLSSISKDVYSCSRSSQPLASSYGCRSKPGYSDKLQNLDILRAAPLWSETGKALTNLSSKAREEDHVIASLRNECFVKAKEAVMLGDEELARELITKVELLDMHMKASRKVAIENVYPQRNQVTNVPLDYGPIQDQLIDLHGLHVTEAIAILAYKLSSLKTRARYIGQRLRALIYTGTGHQTKGTSAPGRLVTAVKQYLLEEGLHYTQPQPGQLYVVI